MASRRANPYGRGLMQTLAAWGPYLRWQTLGDTGAMALRVVHIAARPPFGWWRETVAQISTMTRHTAIPMVVCHFVYMLGFGTILFGTLITDLGVGERVGGFLWVAWVREVSTWITAMVFAGVVGSAITADLGSRKIREELDAMSVLAIDYVPQLIVPRVIATTIALPLLAALSLVSATILNLVVAPAHFGFPTAVFVDNLAANVHVEDVLFPLLLKNACIGFVIGVVASVKGIAAPGGAEGVGRAVNQTVVICFLWIFLFHTAFNIAYLSVGSDLSLLRG